MMNDNTLQKPHAKRLAMLSLALLLVVPSIACQPWVFEKSERRYVFPNAMLNANFAPPRPRFSRWNPVADDAVDRRDTDTRLADNSKPDPEPASEPEPSVPAPTPDVTSSSDGPPLLRDRPGDAAFDANDAIGFVNAVYAINGVSLQKAARTKERTPTIVELYRHVHDKGLLYHSETPAVGDLAFFHNTHDRNADGRWNDWYTLVGVVEGVDRNGSVSVLAYVDGQVHRIFLNPNHPSKRTGNGTRYNTWLRDSRHSEKDAAGSAGKLFAGFGNLLGQAKQVVVIDNWQPGMATAAVE